MANEVATISEGLKALLANNPAIAQRLAALQAAATSGISGGGPPILGCKSTRFMVKEDGNTTPLNYPANYKVEELRGQPITTLPAIVLGAKEGFEKAWYATKFKDGEDTKAPDCYSLDGLKPAADSALPQCESCAGCAMNAFGTGTAADGTPGAGKACTDKKVLAIYFNPAIYKFSLMPTALKGWKKYCNDMSAMGVYLPLAITKIGFDGDKNFPTYTFTFGGMLNETQAAAVLEKLDSAEVQEILKGYSAPAPQGQIAGPAGDDDGAAAKAAKEAEAKAADKKAADEKKAADKKAADEKKAADKKDAEAKAAAQPQTSLTAASDDDIASLLDL